MGKGPLIRNVCICQQIAVVEFKYRRLIANYLRASFDNAYAAICIHLCIRLAHKTTL